MQQSRRTVVGVFDEGAMADQAVAALENAGFSAGQVHRHGSQATGGFMAGLKNLFGGDQNADATGANDFADMGFSNDESNYYESEAQAGRSIVTVRADGREQEAMSVLRENGAYNYGTRSGGSGVSTGTGTVTTTGYGNTTTTGTGNPVDYDTTTTNTTRTGNAATYDNTTTGTTNVADGTDGTRRMRLREEQLQVNKQNVQTGEVGLHKEIISEQKSIDVPVTHEEAYIEQIPVTDSSVADNTPIGEGETIRVPLSEEQVNVNKNTVVTGEVEIGKRAVTENQRVSDTVRREEARLDNTGSARVTGDTNLTGNTDQTTDNRNL